MNALVFVILLPLALGTLRITLTVAAKLASLASLAVMASLVAVLARYVPVPW